MSEYFMIFIQEFGVNFLISYVCIRSWCYQRATILKFSNLGVSRFGIR